MLLGAGLIFGLFLLCSLYLQLVLGNGPLSTGLSFIPLALAAGSRSPRRRAPDQPPRRPRTAGGRVR